MSVWHVGSVYLRRTDTVEVTALPPSPRGLQLVRVEIGPLRMTIFAEDLEHRDQILEALAAPWRTLNEGDA